MNIQITGRHFEITPAIKEFVETKFARIERHFDHITRFHVIMTAEKNRFLAEVILHVPSSPEIVAHCETEDLYKAIDLLEEKVDHLVMKHKEKIKKHH